MYKKIALILAICYSIVLTIFSLIAIKQLPKLGSNYDDKIFHVFAYSVFVLIWYLALHSKKARNQIFIIALCSIIYGIILEVLQGQVTLERHLDLFDILANCIGVAIASLFLVIKNRVIVKNL